ncbi:MAG TPA: YsnF/AvaK domain-containing protein [Pyrinomonadaceae bacterium]|jgi:uncharacterized protein (TIGR02271 family)|nr:YsnF/AvaK domain-containing protein [Pyrinomonadaceae bacterium]
MSQQRARAVLVTDRNGLRGTIDASSPELDSGRGQALVHLENGQQAFVPVDELHLQNDGSYALAFSFSELIQMSAPPRDTRTGGRTRDEQETVVVPVVAERLDVQKRKVESGGVRIKKIVHEREEIIDEPLMREEVQVKRVPVNRVVEGPIPVRHVGNTMIVSLLEEVLVVEKRLMLKEELHITKGEVETYKPQRIMLRTEEATVERVETPFDERRSETTRDATRDAGSVRDNPPR